MDYKVKLPEQQGQQSPARPSPLLYPLQRRSTVIFKIAPFIKQTKDLQKEIMHWEGNQNK